MCITKNSIPKIHIHIISISMYVYIIETVVRTTMNLIATH